MTDSSVTEAAEVTSAHLDTVYMALADEHRRQVLRYFLTTDETVASVDDLIDYAIENGTGDTTHDRLALTFHHIALPKLAELGAVEYDARDQEVRYRGHSLLERLLTTST